MSCLLDTHILLWALYDPDRLGAATRARLQDPATAVWFSAASIWEVAIKFGLGRPDFTASPFEVRAEALAIGFRELAVDGLQAAQVTALPHLHADPFDRLLVAQAAATGLTLLTHNPQVAAYPGPVEQV
ncbi:MAG: type II toxin-antitoxin system VapC family toxin [Propionibacteriaceae bacterium]|jgi:PIN domain nuclease of toxin-antitoxin system|nr:type II toxin-antitoxin system VapC family toxin [Propionibacteriaceae bacterium]